MIRSELVKILAHKNVSITKIDVEKIVKLIFTEIVNSLNNSEFGSCELRNFGRFSIKTQNARLGRNPATGVRISIPVKKKIRFKASSILLKRLNEN